MGSSIDLAFSSNLGSYERRKIKIKNNKNVDVEKKKKKNESDGIMASLR